MVRVEALFELTDYHQTILVGRDSACLQGYESTALTLDHFRLNKFTSPQDTNFVLVRYVLRRMLSATVERGKNIYGTHPCHSFLTHHDQTNQCSVV